MKKVYIQPNMDIVNLSTKENLLQDDPGIAAGNASHYPVGTTIWDNEGTFDEDDSYIKPQTSLWDE